MREWEKRGMLQEKVVDRGSMREWGMRGIKKRR